MSGPSDIVTTLSVIVLLAGFGYAAVADLRLREVSDRLWQLMGTVGVVLGAVAVAPGGFTPVVLWLLVGALALEHMFPWDLRFGETVERQADRVELLAYAGVVAVVAIASARWGIGATAVPWVVVAVLAVVIFSRALFEFGVLYGGADAKALMIAGLLVPVFGSPLLLPLGREASALSYLPFPVSLLTNAALFSIVVPLALAVVNLRRGEFSVPEGFLGYSLPVEELPRRYVWVKDPSVPVDPGVDDFETSEDDTRHRAEIARDLSAKGVREVWVSPQVPFLTVMAVGALSAILFGNLLLDALVWL